jgi:hypothetical protein
MKVEGAEWKDLSRLPKMGSKFEKRWRRKQKDDIRSLKGHGSAIDGRSTCVFNGPWGDDILLFPPPVPTVDLHAGTIILLFHVKWWLLPPTYLVL